MDEYKIAELVKDWYRTTSIRRFDNFLLNDTTIMSEKSYERSYEHNPSISKQVIGYVYNDRTRFVSTLEFPMLQWNFISSAYLYKKGYVFREDSWLGPAPLPNLKYNIYCVTGVPQSEFQDRLVIELVDVDVAANNLNLPKIMSSVLGSKLLTRKRINKDEFYEIRIQMLSQKLFADHTWYDTQHILRLYFVQNERKLSKEVFKISEAYERVFRPRRVVYDTKTWQPVLV